MYPICSLFAICSFAVLHANAYLEASPFPVVRRMFALLLLIAKCALVIMFLGGLIIADHANLRAISRSKNDPEYRRWRINPLTPFSGSPGTEIPLQLTGFAIMAVSMLALVALNALG